MEEPGIKVDMELKCGVILLATEAAMVVQVATIKVAVMAVDMVEVIQLADMVVVDMVVVTAVEQVWVVERCVVAVAVVVAAAEEAVVGVEVVEPRTKDVCVYQGHLVHLM